MTNDLIAKASVRINAPAARVWETLVDPAAIHVYMFGAEAISDWQEGSPIIWKGEWQGTHYQDKGEILRLSLLFS